MRLRSGTTKPAQTKQQQTEPNTTKLYQATPATRPTGRASPRQHANPPAEQNRLHAASLHYTQRAVRGQVFVGFTPPKNLTKTALPEKTNKKRAGNSHTTFTRTTRRIFFGLKQEKTIYNASSAYNHTGRHAVPFNREMFGTSRRVFKCYTEQRI